MSIDLFLFYFYHASYVHQGNKSHLHLVPYILFISVVQVSQGTSYTHTCLVPFVSIFVFYSNLGNKLQFQLVPLLLLFWFINTTQGTSHVIFDLFPICNYSCPLCHSGNKLCYQLACSPSTFFLLLFLTQGTSYASIHLVPFVYYNVLFMYVRVQVYLYLVLYL